MSGLGQGPSSSSSSRVVYPPGCQEVHISLSKNELISRLGGIVQELQNVEQDGQGTPYAPLALHLTSEPFLDHQSNDVKRLIGCCIVEVFRIFAPEAPFQDPDHLKDIFMFLANELRGLSKTESASYSRYFLIVESLGLVKSFNLCLELPDWQEVILHLFKTIFDVIDEKHSDKVYKYCLDILVSLTLEADFIPQNLLDCVLENIVGANKMISKAARTMASDLIVKTAATIEPTIQNFLNGVLVVGRSESELADHAMEIIYELQNIAPPTLLHVLPQLELRLKSGEVKERQAATKLLGRMFKETGSALMDTHKPLWLAFLGRFRDIEASIRLECVQVMCELLIEHPPSLSILSNRLHDSSLDLDDGIRVEVVQGIVKAAKKGLNLVDQELLESVKARCLDKKFKIRQEAISGLGSVYKKYVLTSTEPPALDLSWIPNRVLHGYFQPGLGDRISVERTLLTRLVPYHLTTNLRMRCLLKLYCTVDDHSVKSLHEIFKSQSRLKGLTRDVLAAEPDQGDYQKTLNTKAYQISKMLPDSVKGIEGVKQLKTKLSTDSKLRSQLTALLADDCQCAQAEEHVKAILSRLGKSGPTNNVYSVVKVLLERASSSLLLDTTAAPVLMELALECAEGTSRLREEMGAEAGADCSDRAAKLLSALSTCFSRTFWSEETFRLLSLYLNHNNDRIVGTGLEILLCTCKAKALPSDFIKDVLPRLVTLCEVGDPKQAKSALACLHEFLHPVDEREILEPLFERALTCMHVDSSYLCTALVTIGLVAKFAPELPCVQDMKKIMKRAKKEILQYDQSPTSGSRPTDQWVSDIKASPLTHAKIAVMKAVVRWLEGLANRCKNADPLSVEVTEASSCVREAYGLLHEALRLRGDFTGAGRMLKGELARIRYAAGVCFLKLVQHQVYFNLLSHEQFQSLALLVNDQSNQVRMLFTSKLHRYLLLQRIPLQYMSLFSLVANDPSKQRRTQVKNYMNMNVQRRRDYIKQHPVASNDTLFALLPDYVVPFAVHLLAHDPDLKSHGDIESLKNIKECLWFLMEPLMKDNPSFFTLHNKIFQLIKCSKDAQDPDNVAANCKMYAVCDLGIGLLLTRSAGSSRAESGDPMLPNHYFIRSGDVSQANTKTYLPKDLLFSPAVNKKSRMHPKTVVVKGKGKGSAPTTGSGGVLAEVEGGSTKSDGKEQEGEKRAQGPVEMEDWSPGSKENSDVSSPPGGAPGLAGQAAPAGRARKQGKGKPAPEEEELAVPLKKRKQRMEDFDKPSGSGTAPSPSTAPSGSEVASSSEYALPESLSPEEELEEGGKTSKKRGRPATLQDKGKKSEAAPKASTRRATAAAAAPAKTRPRRAK